MPIPYYFGLASKLERAVRALLILQGKTVDSPTFLANGDCFVSNDSRTHEVLPNRTVAVDAANPERGYRPECRLHFMVQHNFQAALQPEVTNLEEQRVKADAYLAATCDTMCLGDTDDQAMTQLAAAITAAGQWLATPDPDPTDLASAQIVANNADMVNFRVDWIKRATPFHLRGKSPDDSTVWIERLNFEAGCSYATIPN